MHEGNLGGLREEILHGFSKFCSTDLIACAIEGSAQAPTIEVWASVLMLPQQRSHPVGVADTTLQLSEVVEVNSDAERTSHGGLSGSAD